MATRTHSHADKPNAPPDVVIEEGIEEAPAPSAKQLSAVIEIARAQAKLQNKVNRLTKELATAKSDLTQNKTNLLPKAMEQAGITATPLGNGVSVEIDTIVTASVPSPNSDRVENAVERNAVGIAYCDIHCPDLVKNKVVMYFPKGQEKLFNKFLRDMAQRKIAIEHEFERSVHSGTLGKWVREQDALGKTVDEEALGVHRIKIAEVKLPKTKTNKI